MIAPKEAVYYKNIDYKLMLRKVSTKRKLELLKIIY